MKLPSVPHIPKILKDQTNHKPLVNGKSKPPVSEEMKGLFPGLYSGKAASDRITAKGNIQQEIKQDSERKRLYQAAQDFQAIFIGQMLKAMRKNLDPKSDPLYGGKRQEIFEDMLYDEYAKGISRSKGFRLADQIYEQLSRALPPLKDGQDKQDTENAKAGKEISAKPDNAIGNRYIPGQTNRKQIYAADRLRRQVEAAKNRISTSELYKENDWRP